jgi:acetylornithine deacetylase/succinyl-diaminopimelate desuccinylase-like protein
MRAQPSASPAAAAPRGATQEAAELLASLLQLPTAGRSANTRDAALRLRNFLDRQGVDARLVEAGPQQASVVARLAAAPGSSPTAPLLLLSHLDTFPAEDLGWPERAGPWSGAIDGGAVWGRGALDGKGLAALHAMTLALLRRAGSRLPRDVVLVAAADGVAATPRALQQVLALEPDLALAPVVLTKGGASIRDLLGDGRVVHAVATAEKGFAAIEVAAVAPDARLAGARDTSDAPRRLAQALARLGALRVPPRLTPPVLQLLDAAAEGTSPPTRWSLSSPLLARLFWTSDLAARPLSRPLVSDTVEVTFLASGDADVSAAPARARAVVHASLLPGTAPGELLARVRAAIGDPAIHLAILEAAEASSSRVDPETLAELSRAIGAGDGPVAPYLAPEPTGARELRQMGLAVYGFAPWELGADALASRHGAGEHLPLAELERALTRMVAIVEEIVRSIRTAPSDALPGRRG